jgi:hypothetical protein
MFCEQTLELGEKVLHHQLWFFGKDIWHKDGNLLIRYGFERIGVPDGKDGTNNYRLIINELQEIVLFGFGVFWGDKRFGGIILYRYNCHPKMLKYSTLELPIWQSELLPFCFQPKIETDLNAAKSMFSDFCRWVLQYENRIDETCGKQWRKNCLQDWENTEFGIGKIRNSWKKLQKL